MPAQTMDAAQASLDRFCETIGDVRRRADTSVRALAEAEPLLPLPPLPYPATIEHTGPVDANATVAFRGSRYSVPPGFIGAALTVRQRLGSQPVKGVSTLHARPLDDDRRGRSPGWTVAATVAREVVIIHTGDWPQAARASRSGGPTHAFIFLIAKTPERASRDEA